MITFRQIAITAITLDALREVLHQKSVEAGSQKALAAQLGVSPQYLGDVLNGKREPGESILEALGLCKVVHYAHADKAASPVGALRIK